MAIERAQELEQPRPSPSLTSELGRRSSRFHFADFPAEVVELSRQCILDWVGVAIAGAQERLVEILAEEVLEQGGADHATLVGRSGRVSAQQAALVNGSAAHALDYDDVHPALTGHPSAPVVAAVLALGEQHGSSGRELIEAFVAGYETSCRIGALVNPAHYEAGYHATATIGCFGSAAACARLMGLDAEQTATAFGIAATQAAGLKSMFGTMCKPLHAGKAAQNGMLAASLAARGFDSRRDAIECDLGFAKTLSTQLDLDAALADPPGGYFLFENLFKYHAACYLTHASIECTRRLRDEHALGPDDIREIVVRANPGCDSVCNILEPATGLEAKFSFRFTTAMALAGVDTAAIANYSDAATKDPALVSLRDRVQVEFDNALGRMASEVIIRTANDATFETFHDAAVAETDLAKQRARLEAKFRCLVEPIRGKEGCASLLSALDAIEELDDCRVISSLLAS